MRKSKEEVRGEQLRRMSAGMKRLITGYRTLLEDALEAENITVAQLRMLRALGERADTSAAELARICFITPQSMQAIVTRAERVGWIVRTASATNRRVLTASLTRAGQKVLERGLAVWGRIEQNVWSEAKLGELEAVNRILDKALVRMQGSLDDQHAAAAMKRLAVVKRDAVAARKAATKRKTA